MFFYLGNDCDLLIKQSERLYTDLGWKTHQNVLYKGYCLDYNIDDNIDKILSGDKPQGIYCVVKDDKLFYPEIRPFPLYTKENTLTNLRLENFSEVENNKYQLPSSTKSFDEVVKNVIDILVENLSKFELNIWCTGGVDSTMLIAIAEYANLPYTVHVAKPKHIFQNIRQWEGTVEEYSSKLLDFCRTNYWAYSFLSNFKNKVITTGFYGDEYFCRSLWQINQLANGFGLTGIDVAKPNHYIYKHMNKQRFADLHKVDESLNVDNIKFNTIQSLGTNHVWHLDNTITFCPLMDKRIVDNVWSLDAKTLLECSVDATIQKEIIKNTTPDVLSLTDSYKNSGEGRIKFFLNKEKVKLSHCTDLIVH